MADNQEMIIAVIGTLLGVAAFIPILSGEGFTAEAYLDPSLIVNLAIFLPIALVTIYFSIKRRPGK